MVSSEKEGPPILSLADFDACVLDAPIAALNQVEMTRVSLAYQQASATTPSPCKEVFRLLGEIAGIHLNPAERGRLCRAERTVWHIWQVTFKSVGGTT
jgi:hypothetical protein